MSYQNDKVIDCTKNTNPVIHKKLKEVSVEEGEQIAAQLFEILSKRKDGIGLAANQIGIDAAVAVVNVREPIVLINPKIVEKHNEVDYYEGCLSYPGKGVHTKRYETVHIKTAQSESGWIFSGCDVGESAKGTWEAEKAREHDREERLLEAVCVQHEIDHLNGIVCMDRRVDTTIRVEKKIGRNHLVTIKKGDAVKVLKYKKAQKFLNEGWVME